MAKGAVCKTVSCGFNSHPRLHFLPNSLYFNHLQNTIFCRFFQNCDTFCDTMSQSDRGETMELAVRNLVTRGKNFYFRYRLPSPFNASDIRISLKTTDLKKAVLTCRLAAEKVTALINTGAFSMITLEEMRKRIAAYIKNELEKSERYIAVQGRICPSTREYYQHSLTTHEKYCRNALFNNDLDDVMAIPNAKEMLKDLNPSEEDIALMGREFLKARLYFSHVMNEVLAGKRLDAGFTEEDYREILSGKYRSESEIKEAEKVYTLRELTEKFLNEKLKTVSISIRNEYQWCMNLLLEIFSPEINIRHITHDNLLDLRDNILKKYPLNVFQKKEFRGMPAQEIVKRYKGQPLSTATVNEKLIKIGSFFRWCHLHRNIDMNPAVGLTLKDSRKENTLKIPYSVEGLNSLFTHLRSDNLCKWRPYKFWIPIIALYSGARQTEICQLYTDDIINIKGILCFKITNDKEKKARVKTASGKRLLPIHPILLQLGFLSYVTDRMKAISRIKGMSNIILWDGLVSNEKQGWGYTFEKFFSRFNEKIRDDKRTTFHSLRHNFANNLKQNGVSEIMLHELMGHSNKDISTGRYALDYAVENKLAAILKQSHGINLFEIFSMTPLSDDAVKEQMKAFPEKQGTIIL